MSRSPRAARPVVRAAVLAGASQLVAGCVVASSSSRDGSGGAGFLFFLLPLGLLLLMATRLGGGRRRGRRREPEQSDAVNLELLRAELSVLADDVIRLEPQVALKDEARSDYEAAAHRYRVAQTALESTTAPLDLIRVQRVVDEGTWAMARARAILDGRPPPAPPEPLQRPGPHGEPAIGVDDRDGPVYVDSPAPFRSGWFGGGGGGGLFGGLLLGSMLGGFGGWVVHDMGDDQGEGDWLGEGGTGDVGDFGDF